MVQIFIKLSIRVRSTPEIMCAIECLPYSSPVTRIHWRQIKSITLYLSCFLQSVQRRTIPHAHLLFSAFVKGRPGEQNTDVTKERNYTTSASQMHVLTSTSKKTGCCKPSSPRSLIYFKSITLNDLEIRP